MAARFGGLRLGHLLWVLLLCIPGSLILHWRHAPATWVFAASCLAIVPLAALMGRATENLAERVGPTLGGLLNASFGNAAELILAISALSHGQVNIVKASLTGSIMGNILLVMGLSLLTGGLRFSVQKFNPMLASMGATMLMLSAMGLVVPAAFHALYPNTDPARDITLSTGVAAILFLIYLLGLLFQLGTHRKYFAPTAGPSAEELHTVDVPHEHWSVRRAVGALVLATLGIALMSETLVSSVEETAAHIGLSKVFVGVIVVALVGNAAEQSSAILMALRNKMDLAMNIVFSSSVQISLFVAPVLVFAGRFMGQPMTLDFSPLEVVAVILAVVVATKVAGDGETNWLEGAQLLAVYAILAWLFFELPIEPGAAVTPH